MSIEENTIKTAPAAAIAPAEAIAVAADVAEIVYLTPQNAVFAKTSGGFISLAFNETAYKRVKVARTFPFELPDNYICVRDTDDKEIGIISDINEFTGEQRDALQGELDRCYFTPKIQRISSVKEQFGYSYWVADTDKGRLSFSIKDTYRNIVKCGNGRFFLCDVEGNRYEIEDIEKLDNKSISKLEIYL